jgi:hypothetical protein
MAKNLCECYRLRLNLLADPISYFALWTHDTGNLFFLGKLQDLKITRGNAINVLCHSSQRFRDLLPVLVDSITKLRTVIKIQWGQHPDNVLPTESIDIIIKPDINPIQ